MGRTVALLLLGILLGMVVMQFLQGKRVDDYYWEKEELKVELYEATERLKRIEEQHDRLLPALVEDIRLEITMEDDSFVEPELRKLIYDLAKELIGQEFQALPYPLVYNVLDNRILESEDKKYRLKVKAVIIAETVTYYLTVEKIQEETVGKQTLKNYGIALTTSTNYFFRHMPRRKEKATSNPSPVQAVTKTPSTLATPSGGKENSPAESSTQESSDPRYSPFISQTPLSFVYSPVSYIYEMGRVKMSIFPFSFCLGA